MSPLADGRPRLRLRFSRSSKLLREPIADSAMKPIDTHDEGIITEGQSLVAMSDSRDMFPQALMLMLVLALIGKRSSLIETRPLFRLLPEINLNGPKD